MHGGLALLNLRAFRNMNISIKIMLGNDVRTMLTTKFN